PFVYTRPTASINVRGSPDPTPPNTTRFTTTL
ncbi:hypothetical protein P3T36_007933, partial [Kitasatospora sp. MAP12-15]